MKGANYSVGSVWRRWDPHIHTPGTIFNDNYRTGDAGWEDFLSRIESADPPIFALGITDYYVLDGYERTLEFKKSGRLSNVDLIFPNVELRLGVGTVRGSPINIHVLVSPDDDDHVAQTKRFLSELSFRAYDEVFRCAPDDLKRLGRAHARASGEAVPDDRTALALGCNQFKVNFDELKDAWGRSAWIRENALIAVAAGSSDGTSGLARDASQATQRAEIEKAAHVIFSSHPKQRAFWLGEAGNVSREQLDAIYGGRKPCIHGSDAHAEDRVGNPAQNRYCWIKGDPTFEGLRQACIEPTRAYVGDLPPEETVPSQTIRHLKVTNAPWIATGPVSLNPGLVCIIGARGSGKTALADLIAAGAAATSSTRVNKRSFLHRAAEFLSSSASQLLWGDDDTTEADLSNFEDNDFWTETRAQYLSQQFVEQLCAADGLTNDLLAEIERVIFQAHPTDDRYGATDFGELLDRRVGRFRMQRVALEEELAELSASLSTEREREASLPILKKKKQAVLDAIERAEKDRKAISVQGNEVRANELNLVTKALDGLSAKVDKLNLKRNAVIQLQDSVKHFRENASKSYRANLQAKNAEAALSETEWRAFEPVFGGDVDAILSKHLAAAQSEIKALRGVAPTPLADPNAGSYLVAGKDLNQQTIYVLQAEQKRLQDLIGVDQTKVRRLQELTSAISREQATLQKIETEISQAEAAGAKIADIRKRRRECYKLIFDAIRAEEMEVAALYKPLKERLDDETGALSRLTFSVRRIADVKAWADAGERLLDLRKGGPFRGQGSLHAMARDMLQKAWEEGDSDAVTVAMDAFLSQNQAGLMDHSPVDRSDADAYRGWVSQVAEWLYDTKHIRIAYGINYDGVDIEQLSPGTRGIVLLLLYLSVDREDPRPLIIDQPEENLDPKSIFDELVERFLEAKQRRQIIVVTHNANLVVNTDADQVIVASCSPHRPGSLPEISYISGGLENPEIRRSVCEILEGGEAAFRDRARRLRLHQL